MATTKLEEIIDGAETSVVLQEYADRILIMITQLGKVGSLIQASIPPATSFVQPDSQQPSQEPSSLENLPPPPPSIQLTPLFGAAPSAHLLTLHNLYASQVATLYWTSFVARDNKPVITGIALKRIQGNNSSASENQVTEQERRTFHAIMGLVRRVIREHFK